MAMVQILEQFQKQGDGGEVSDTTILNVFRRKDEKVLKTAEIAEELPIVHDWTAKRLKRLEESGRVHSKSAGRGRVWWLDESEPSFPVAEGIGDILWYASLAQEAGNTALMTAGGMFVVSGVLLIPIFMIGLYPSMSPFTTSEVATVAMLAALVAGLFLLVGGGLRVASYWVNRHYALE